MRHGDHSAVLDSDAHRGVRRLLAKITIFVSPKRGTNLCREGG